MVMPNDHSVDSSPSKDDQDDQDYFHTPVVNYDTHDKNYLCFPSSPRTSNQDYLELDSSSISSGTTNSSSFMKNNSNYTLSYTAAAEAAALNSLTTSSIEEEDKDRNLQHKKRKYGQSPERVKRPPNAYLLFNRDMRRQLQDVHQGLTSGEISKSISARWKKLSKVRYTFIFIYFISTYL
jgi:hypothetical protein